MVTKKPAAPQLKVVDDVFTYSTKRGKTLSIDLDIPPEFFKKAAEGDKGDDEQFEAIAGWLDQETQDAFNEMGALERARFIKSFFAAFSEAAELPLGGILQLLAFVEEHRSTLTWDFRRYLGLSLRRIGRDFTYGEASAFIVELINETGSHLSMEHRGLDRAASQADEASILHATGFINRHRDVKKFRQPLELPNPWKTHDPNADVTPERRAELSAQLERRSAFAKTA